MILTLYMYIVLLVFCAFHPAIAVLENITILTTNDTYGQITYTGSWNKSAIVGCSNTSTTTTGSQSWNKLVTDVEVYANATSLDATATFKFTGVAVYYLPILVLGTSGTSNEVVSLTLDSNTPQPISLASPGGPYLVAPQTGGALTNGSHTVVLAISQGGGTLNGFIYTADRPSPNPSPSSSPSPSPSPNPGNPNLNSSPSPSKHKKNIRAIVGGIIGAIVAIALAVIAFLNAHHLTQLFLGLLFSLFGIFLFKGRRVAFRCDEDLPSTEVTLLVTRDVCPSDFKEGDSERLVVWQVFNIGGAERDFSVTFPCSTRAGWPDVSVGTITDKGKLIECETSELAPAFLDNDGVWQREEPEKLVQEKPKREKSQRRSRPKIMARNQSELDARIALGTSDGTEMRPFLLIEDSIFKRQSTYETEMDLYIHAFRSNGYVPGQVDDTILARVQGDRLTPEGGLHVSQLAPLTTWYLRSQGGGRLSLEIGRNQSKDIKKYQHDCKLDKKALKKSDSMEVPLAAA